MCVAQRTKALPIVLENVDERFHIFRKTLSILYSIQHREEFYDNGWLRLTPKVADPTLTFNVKKHTKCFYSDFAAIYLLQATGLLVGFSKIMQRVVYKQKQSL